MRIILNGKEEAVEDGLTVGRLLQHLKIEPVRVAVELNEEIVPRKALRDTSISEGDRIEIVTFVGGG